MKALALLLISSLLPAQKPGARQTQPAKPEWVLTFDDEFDGAELDLSHWSPHDPWGHVRDRELQGWAPDAIEIGGGQMHLAARRTTGARPVRYDGKDRE